ncbi:hypothetical protein MOQ95_005739 [Salmonella enterica]|nr:hypothetical protein [Salmonella enterica]
MNLLTWPERLISRLTGENEEEKTMTEPTQTQNAGIAAASDTALTGSLDFEVLRGILAAIGYDIPRDRFESAVFLATSDTKAHG